MPVKHKALLVGNATFPQDSHNLRRLHGPPNDIAGLSEALIAPDLGLHRPENVTTLLDATSDEIRAAADVFFGDAGPEDQLLFYYSGHGRSDIRGNLYLCAQNTRCDRLISTALADSTVNEMIQSSPARRFLLIIDACYSGRFKGGESSRTLQGAGRFVLTSCRANELSEDARDMSAMSPFTQLLVQGLTSAGVDTEGSGHVTVNALYSWVLPRLQASTRQIPLRICDRAIGDLIVGKSRPRAASPRHDARPPVLNLSHTEITVPNARPGEAPADEIVEVYNSGGGTLDWIAECHETWVHLEQSKTRLRIRLDPHTGSDQANIVVRDRATNEANTIHVVVKAESDKPAQLAVEPTSIDFGVVPVGGPLPVATLRLFNLGGGALHATVHSSEPRIAARLSEDIVTIRPDNSMPGPIKGTITIQSAGGSVAVPVAGHAAETPVLAVSQPTIDFGDVDWRERPSTTLQIRDATGRKLQWTWRLVGGEHCLRIDRRAEDAITVELSPSTPGCIVAVLHIEAEGGACRVPIQARVLRPERIPPATRVQIDGRWIARHGDLVNIVSEAGGWRFTAHDIRNTATAQGSIVQRGRELHLRWNSLLLGVEYHGAVRLAHAQLQGELRSWDASMQLHLTRQ